METQIIEIIEKYLLDKEFIEKAYLKFKKGDIENASVKNLKGIFKQWGANQECDSFQIDLPYWLEKRDPNKKTIMILGMDANSKDNNDKESLILSAPYFAQDNFNESSNSPKIDELDKSLQYIKLLAGLNESFNIYMTDLYKLFFRYNYNLRNKGNDKIKSHLLPTYTHNDIHYEILSREIEEVKPNFILALGDVARSGASFLNEAPNFSYRETITKDSILEPYPFKLGNFEAKLVGIPHLSRATRDSAWNNFFEKNGFQTKIEYANRLEKLLELINRAFTRF